MSELNSYQENICISPWRLRKSFSLIKLLCSKAVKVKGIETLQNLDKDEQIVVATTHRTDLDLPLSVFALSGYMDMAITDMSLNHIIGSPGSRLDRLGLIAIGESNFIPIDYQSTTHGKQVPALFNPDNFVPMAKAIANGKKVVVSAQNPSSTHKFHKPGIAVPYLTALTGASVLPVSVLQVDNSKRASFEVTIGNPLELQQIDSIAAIKNVTDMFKSNGHPTVHDIQAFRAAKLALQHQAQIVINTLNDL